MNTSTELRAWVEENSALTCEDILNWLMACVDEDVLIDSLGDLKTAIEDGNY